MKRLMACVAATTAIFLAGCGGDSSGQSGYDLLEGTWRGWYVMYRTNGSVDHEGTIDISINAFGSIVGDIDRDDTGDIVTIGGSIQQPEGNTSLSWSFPGYGSTRNATGISVVRNLRLEPGIDNTDANRLDVRNSGGDIGKLDFSLTKLD